VAIKVLPLLGSDGIFSRLEQNRSLDKAQKTGSISALPDAFFPPECNPSDRPRVT
jgi:hypothetical protein